MDAPVLVRVDGVYIAESEGGSPKSVVLLENGMERIVPIFVGTVRGSLHSSCPFWGAVAQSYYP